MKKCKDCNIDMTENIKVKGQHIFEHSESSSSNIFLDIPTGEKSSFFGLTVDKTFRVDLKARMCPKCGKVEMYVDAGK